MHEIRNIVDWGDHSDTCNWSSRVPENTLSLQHIMTRSIMFLYLFISFIGSTRIRPHWKIHYIANQWDGGCLDKWPNLATCFQASRMSSTMAIGGLTKLRGLKMTRLVKNTFGQSNQVFQVPCCLNRSILGSLKTLKHFLCRPAPPPSGMNEMPKSQKSLLFGKFATLYTHNI